MRATRKCIGQGLEDDGKRKTTRGMSAQRTVESFVARIWLEGESESIPTWRGHVQHVQGEGECYFQELSTLKAFLARITGIPMPDEDSKEEI